jgi:hypothetical protein
VIGWIPFSLLSSLRDATPPRVRSTENQRKQADTSRGSCTQKELKALLPLRSARIKLGKAWVQGGTHNNMNEYKATRKYNNNKNKDTRIYIVARMWRLYKTGIGLTTGFIRSHTITVYTLYNSQQPSLFSSTEDLGSNSATTAATNSYGVPCHHSPTGATPSPTATGSELYSP